MIPSPPVPAFNFLEVPPALIIGIIVAGHKKEEKQNSEGQQDACTSKP
jgi:hypothetical protein